MDRTEITKFIENELMGLWPEWIPTEAESRVWFGVLSRYDYDIAQMAAQQYFSETGGNYKRPKPKGIIEKVRNILHNQNIGEIEQSEIYTTVFIECIEPPERNPNLKGKRKAVYAAEAEKQCDPDHVLACANTMCRRYEHLYGGSWITVQTNPPEDSGLRGEQAKQKAFRDILKGPDTRTKRWLQNYLSKSKDEKSTAKKDSGKPLTVGAIIEDNIPF